MAKRSKRNKNAQSPDFVAGDELSPEDETAARFIAPQVLLDVQSGAVEYDTFHRLGVVVAQSFLYRLARPAARRARELHLPGDYLPFVLEVAWDFDFGPPNLQSLIERERRNVIAVDPRSVLSSPGDSPPNESSLPFASLDKATEAVLDCVALMMVGAHAITAMNGQERRSVQYRAGLSEFNSFVWSMDDDLMPAIERAIDSLTPEIAQAIAVANLRVAIETGEKHPTPCFQPPNNMVRSNNIVDQTDDREPASGNEDVTPPIADGQSPGGNVIPLGETSNKGGRPTGGSSVNARMTLLVEQDKDAVGWSAQQFATALGCSKSSVHGTKFWKSLQAVRGMDELVRLQKKTDKRRRQKPINPD